MYNTYNALCILWSNAYTVSLSSHGTLPLKETGSDNHRRTELYRGVTRECKALSRPDNYVLHGIVCVTVVKSTLNQTGYGMLSLDLHLLYLKYSCSTLAGCRLSQSYVDKFRRSGNGRITLLFMSFCITSWVINGYRYMVVYPPRFQQIRLLR